MKEQKALLKKQGYLEIRDPDRAATLRHLMPTFEQLTTDIAWRVYDAFNDRTDHALEGWERMGLVVPMVRLSTDGDWITLTDSIPEADRHTLLNMAARDPERLVSSAAFPRGSLEPETTAPASAAESDAMGNRGFAIP